MEWRTVESPWGEVSDQILFAEFDGLPVRFLPRHGRGHRLSPGGINYRANIEALKRAGVTDLVSVSACGSLREDLTPGTLVLVDQFVDRTVGRPASFFGNGMVGHVSMADPVSPLLAQQIRDAATAAGIAVHQGGTYLNIEGPQFSTRAESRLYQSWGCDVIGMTNMPEARLAREAEICYATLAMVTDYDCWRPRRCQRPRNARGHGQQRRHRPAPDRAAVSGHAAKTHPLSGRLGPLAGLCTGHSAGET